MAEYTIDKIEYDGNVYKLQDNESGFVTTQVFYGTCETAAGTAAKVVTCANFTSSDLKAGVIIVVNFSATNSAAVGDLTLNINNTGAKKIQYINNGIRTNLLDAGYLKASVSYPFIYDGTYWLAQFNYNTTYSAMTAAEAQAGTATTGRIISPLRLKEAIQLHAPDTNTTYALSGALSSHKFTSTLTAGGSGSGTSTSDFTLAAGTGITITDDTSARKMTIACSVTNTDEKVTTAALTSGTLYYPILATGTGTATRQIDSTLKGLTYKSTAGTSSTVGSALLTLGNDIAEGTANNEEGQLALYGPSGKYEMIVCAPSANRIVTLPDQTGTLATTKDIYESVELTQLEYDALSSTDKNDPKKVYFVKDADPSETSELLDMFYPVGTIYETQDLDFDPQFEWGGSWTMQIMEMANDKIVEEGTANSPTSTDTTWTWRKWSSGIAECWGRSALASANYAANSPVQISRSLPANVFNAVPSVTASGGINGVSNSAIASVYSNGSSVQAYLVNRTTSAQNSKTAWISYHFYGTWKTYSAPTTTCQWRRVS